MRQGRSHAGQLRVRPLDRRLIRGQAVLIAAGLSMLIGLVSAAAVVVQAVALAHLVASAMPEAVPAGRTAWMLWLAAGFGARGLCGLAGEIVGAWAAAAVKAGLRARLLEAAVHRTASEGVPGAGDVAILAGSGMDALDAYAGHFLPGMVQAATIPVLLVVAIAMLNWPAGVIVLVAVGLFPLFGALTGSSAAALASSRWSRVQDFGRQIADLFDGLPVLRAFGRTRAERERMAAAAEALRRSSMTALRVAFLSALVLDTLASLSVALVAVPLGLLLVDGRAHLVAALAVLIITPEVFVPLRRASAGFHESTVGLEAAGRVFAIIEAAGLSGGGARRAASGGGGQEGPVSQAGPSGPSGPGRGQVGRPVVVALDRVRVVLPGHPGSLLDGASLTISRGETVAIVGPNGAGKSVALSLLLGFIRPDSGMVTAGGHELREADLDSWWKRVAYMPGTPVILPDTLAANVRLGNPGAGDEEIAGMLEEVGASPFLARLPSGLETVLGEAGRPVSAGERQRIALARTLLRPASLYLLDEPTAHLDAGAEEAAVRAIGGACAGRSAVIVTHRPAPAQIADRVLMLRDGHFEAVEGDKFESACVVAGVRRAGRV